MKVKRFLRSLRSPRTALSLVSVVILALVLYFSRHEIEKAWGLLGQANLWLLVLLLPLQFGVYYAGGEMIFSYLRKKKLIHHVSRFEQARIALELNLVNHIFPSGGISGISYTTWRMSKLGVNSASSTFAQLVRYVASFVSTMFLLVLAVALLALDGQVNRYIVSASFLLITGIVVLTFIVIFMFSSRERMRKIARIITRAINAIMRWVTFGKYKEMLDTDKVEKFFSDMYDDFKELSSDWKMVVKPLAWGVLYSSLDILMFMVAFWSLGYSVNPAVLLIGYCLAGISGIVAFTPGGAGFYEAIMILFLSMAGISSDVAIAGIVLTRVILLTGTIVFGYMFYQHALIKYGKPRDAAF